MSLETGLAGWRATNNLITLIKYHCLGNTPPSEWFPDYWERSGLKITRSFGLDGLGAYSDKANVDTGIRSDAYRACMGATVITYSF